MGEEAEKRTEAAGEELVQSEAFGEILARVTQNVMGLTKIGFDVLDLTVRNLRLAGRPDITRLGRQLGRNEDKLERVLQEVEQLQDQVARLEDKPRRAAASSKSNGRSSNGGSGSGSTSKRSGSTKSKSRSG